MRRNNSQMNLYGKGSLPIVGCLVLFSVVLGTTDLGFIPVPTAAKSATIMHLPTIVASLLEGWPAGMIVGAVFGLTSMYTPSSAVASDPLVVLLPRILVGITPYLTYRWTGMLGEYSRLGLAAVVGTLTNTVGFLGMAWFLGYFDFETIVDVAWKHGLPEIVVAVLIVLPAVVLLRKAQVWIETVLD
ncbi:ECF transporter S component [uncultured Pseudodesulfovibrio sp.]|uniref:ECF transporter S component n=1 Tax=uncultured Pseudodesulfovibrio sp. TaxID=2035858 RepID=UPI0029C8B36A|nr:ECF transporter S component [uncultured Pseudodesulfovibrio sp.]